MRSANRIKAGTIGVDAGICWIGDPCYILHAEPAPKEIGETWSDFCDILTKIEKKTGESTHSQIGRGTGVVVSTGYGDGSYPVYIELDSSGRVARAIVDFTGGDDN